MASIRCSRETQWRPFGLLASIILTTSLAWAHAAAAQPVDIHISARDCSGEPIENLELRVAPSSQPSEEGFACWGVTDPDGNATIRVSEGLREPFMIAQALDGWQPERTYEQQEARFKAYQNLKERCAIRSYYRIDIPDDTSEVRATIVFEKSVRVTGRLIDANGDPVLPRVSIAPDLAWSPIFGGRDGRFQIPGVIRNEKCYIQFLHAQDDLLFWWWVTLTPDDMTHDVDLGEVVVPAFELDSTLRVRIKDEDFVWADEDPHQPFEPGVTLNPADLSNYLFCFPAWDAAHENYAVCGGVPGVSSSKHDLPIPAGTYFLVPGRNAALDAPIIQRAIALVRSGVAANLPEWPKVTLEPGDEIEVTLDAAKVTKLINQAAKEPKERD